MRTIHDDKFSVRNGLDHACASLGGECPDESAGWPDTRPAGFSAAYSVLRDAWGQACGWDRRQIRHDVRRNAGMPAEELAERTLTLFRERLSEALERFPAYADKVRGEAGGLPERGTAFIPSDVPVWTREDQRRLFASLNGPPVDGSFAHSTGGSTGVPLRFYVTRESYEWRCAVSDRGYSWAGAEEGQRSFYVWGTPITSPAWRKRIKSELHHWLQRRTYFDSFHFGDEEKRRCCEGINRARPRALVGYAGNLIELARFVRDNPGLLKWRSRTIVTAAEGLAPGRRELLEQHLGEEVFMSYGSREFMLIGMECREHRGYHIASDNLLVEVVDDQGQPCAPETTGRILITDLRNAANPFIRYEIGDLGAMAAEPCPCGLPFPLLSRVEGRLQEVIQLPDGNRLTALFIPHLMKEFPWIEGYQIAQDVPARLTVMLITKEELRPELTGPVRRALAEKVGAEMTIGFDKVNELWKNRSGKTPIVVGGGVAAQSLSHS